MNERSAEFSVEIDEEIMSIEMSYFFIGPIKIKGKISITSRSVSAAISNSIKCGHLNMDVNLRKFTIAYDLGKFEINIETTLP